MADNDIIQKRRIDGLYKHFTNKAYRRVPKMCDELPERSLHRIGLHNDTVLHMAAQSKQKDLVLDLLKKLPANRNDPLSSIKNNDGNTILHEVATSDDMKDVAEEMLKCDRELLLTARNDSGETPIFCAARYGQIEMFKFLAEKMGLEEPIPEESKAHLRRNDGTTVLHISIITECFPLALYISESYLYLIEERDQFSMTAFQYLACNPTIFQRRRTRRRREIMEQRNIGKELLSLKEFIPLFCYCFTCVMSDQEICRGMRWEAKFNKMEKIIKERYSLEGLIRHLVKNDTSWDANINSQAVSLGENKESEIEEHSSKLSHKKEGQNSQDSEYKKSDESPLFLATKSNIKEIVEEILTSKPQTLMHTNKEGMNILQVAILYRCTDIFYKVVECEVLARKLLSATDKEGNSIIHMISQKNKSEASEKTQNPALQLHDELLLFEKVKSASKMFVSNPLNKDNKTAEELFAASNKELHKEAKEWLMRSTENCTILSVFIATVAFAAAYTVPGGPNQDTGIPILHSNSFFVVFILADVGSLTLALTSVGIFLSILTSSFPLEDFKKYLFDKLKQGIICLVLSVSMMAVAFGATIVLIMTPNQKLVVWDVVAFLPVPIFFLSYSPLRRAALGPYREGFKIFVFTAVGILYVAVIFVFLLLRAAFKGLRWTLKKACGFMCKTHVPRISWKKSQPKSHIQSPQPPAAPPTQV